MSCRRTKSLQSNKSPASTINRKSFQTNIPENKISEVYWTPAEVFSYLGEPCLEVIISPLVTTAIQVMIVDSSGYIAEDELQLKVKKNRSVFIPNVFTPNEEGINDIFHIQGTKSVKKVSRFIILNRWGEIIFEHTNFDINDPTQGWDGTFKGDPLNSGVFVYLAEIEYIDGFVSTFKGDVTLIR